MIMIIDGTDLILGRMATFAAKQALLGESVDIVNCAKAVVSGKKANTYAFYVQKASRGTPRKGAFVTRSPDRLVRRTIRGMLPYKNARGMEAFKRVMCYTGVPPGMQGQKMETIAYANMSKLPNLRYVTVADIAKHLGGKVSDIVEYRKEVPTRNKKTHNKK
ncbi:50S ribosomal protein L13 [Candidatus Woesearchaeota archaeon]|nr:50S ribosomal protein L13 [Candidatus Woesearchaeota archaeon]